MTSKHFLCVGEFDSGNGSDMRAGMIDVSAKIREIRRRAKLNQAGFADVLGVTQSTVSRWENNLQQPEVDAVAKIKSIFGDDLLPYLPEAKEPEVSRNRMDAGRGSPEYKEPPSFFDARDRIPVYASVEGGPGEMVVSTDPIDWAVRPWYLREVKDGYAVVVVGESMAPAFEPGDLAIVNPKAPLVRNKVAIFVRSEHDGDFTATIKRFVKQTATTWVVEQFNPPEGAAAIFELPRDTWKAYRVVGKYDGG
jgi:phage repressor protein C with HTH and peptisase S24 domain